MCRISSEEILLWRREQLAKGGNTSSIDILLECLGGISHEELNLIKLKSQRNFSLKMNLDLIESSWDEHLYRSVPIQHLCGITFWRDLKLKISEKVLIPRQETELIVEIVLKLFEKYHRKILFAELGTGSGAISIALSLARPSWEGIATDIDKNALDLALENFFKYSNNSNLKFLHGSWFKPLKNLKGKLDIVISNPPYIPKGVYEKLPNAVKKFEPEIALLGGEDGLAHIREIIELAPLYLRKEGWLVLENHFDQGAKVREIFIANGFTLVRVLKDFSGIGRFTIGRYK